MKNILNDLKELIKKYPLVTYTPATTRILKTPAEIRKEADRDLKDGKKIIEKLYSLQFRKHLLDAADKGKPVTLTTPRKVLVNTANIRALEAHIRKYWKIRDIIFAAQFLHGGTHKEDMELARLWEALVRSCYITIGAASILKMQDSHFFAGYAFADEDDGLTLYDYTLDALIEKVPKEYRKQLDAATRLGNLQLTADELKSIATDTYGLFNRHIKRTEGYLAIMPDKDELGELRKATRNYLDRKKPSTISKETAARIFKNFYPDPKHTYTTLTGHTVGNWIKRGEMPKYPNFKINETALASKMSFLQWIVSNCHEIGIEINLPSTMNQTLNNL